MSKRLKEEVQQACEVDPHAPLSRRDAAAYLRRKYLVGSQSYLAKAAVRGDGPVHNRLGNRTIYCAAALDDWAKRLLSGPRTEATHRTKSTEQPSA